MYESYFLAALCFTFKAEKSLIVRQIQYKKPLNRFKRVETCIMRKTTLRNESVQCTSTSVYVYIFTAVFGSCVRIAKT